MFTVELHAKALFAGYQDIGASVYSVQGLSAMALLFLLEVCLPPVLQCV